MSPSPAPAPVALPSQQAGSALPQAGLLQGTNVYSPFYFGGGGEAKGGFIQAFLSQSSFEKTTVLEKDEEEQTTHIFGTQTPRQRQTGRQTLTHTQACLCHTPGVGGVW